jgi:hypothetical protein
MIIFWYVIIVKIGIFYKKHFSIDFVKKLYYIIVNDYRYEPRRQNRWKGVDYLAGSLQSIAFERVL